jgi:hypothetical protein
MCCYVDLCEASVASCLSMTRNTECFLEGVIKLKDKTKTELHLLGRLVRNLSCFPAVAGQAVRSCG